MTFDFAKELEAKLGPSDEAEEACDFLSTGVLPLNFILSGTYVGGIPVGRIVEIYGGESSGKTALATMIMSEAQKKGGLAVFLDYENTFDPRRARVFGLNTSDRATFWLKKPETTEACFQYIEKIAEIIEDAKARGKISAPTVIVVDSVAAMSTMAECETDYGDLNMKTNLSLAMVLSRCLKKITSTIHKNNITLLFLNQTRDNPGVLYGEKEKTTGGKALKFYASTRIRLTKEKRVQGEDKSVLGEIVRAVVVKNKVFRPYGECVYTSSFTEGIDLIDTHVNFAAEAGILGTTKGWVEYNGQKMRRKELVDNLKSSADEYREFLEYIKQAGK